MAAPKLTVIGLDAATFDVIDPLLAAGDLPNLARLIERGARGPLRSTTHPLTPLAWTTMVTGVNAGRHGIWDFSERDETGYGLRLVNGSSARAPALWTRLAAAGRRVGVVNVPFTWPAPEVDGFVLAGMDAWARDDGMTTPRALIAELHERFGVLLTDHNFPLDKDDAFDLAHVRAVCEQRVELVELLTARYSRSCSSSSSCRPTMCTTWAGQTGRSGGARASSPRSTGCSTARSATCSGESATTGTCSSSRITAAARSTASSISTRGSRARDISPTASAVRSGSGLGHRLFELRRKLPAGLRRAAKQRLPRLRERAYRVRALLPSSTGRTPAPSRTARSATSSSTCAAASGTASWSPARSTSGCATSSSSAYCGSSRRTANGSLPPSTGAKISSPGRSSSVPDLVVEFRDYAWLGKGNLTERAETIEDRIGVRDIRGRASRESPSGRDRRPAGPAARAGTELSAAITDIAPTVLYLLGEPIPADLEGRLLTEAIDRDLLDREPPEYVDAVELELGAPRPYDAEGVAEVEDRLRSLGYLE